MPLQRDDRRRCARRTSAAMRRAARRRRRPASSPAAPSDLHADETATLRALARVRLNADGRPLAAPRAGAGRAARARRSRSGRAISTAVAAGRHGRRDRAARRRRASSRRRAASSASTSAPLSRPTRPWINVLANPGFGAQISEAGGGYSWAAEQPPQHAHALVERPGRRPGRRVVPAAGPRTLRGLERRRRRPAATAASEYRVAHGQGYSVISHRTRRARRQRHLVRRSATSAVKQVRLRLVNRGHRTLQLRVVGIAEWILGANRSDRGTTLHAASPARAAPGSATAPTRATSRPRAAHDRAVLHPARPRRPASAAAPPSSASPATPRSPTDWTCDRRELFDARGRARPARPATARRSGGGLDPCAALATRVTLRAGDTIERAFLLGYGAEPEGAQALAASSRAGAAAAAPAARCATRWDELLGATAVQTPDPLFDAHGQPLAALPDGRLPALGQGRLLPGRRRLRLPRPAAGRDGARLGRARACCAARSCSPRRASSPRATCSTGGTRPPAPACAPISPTTCCGCRTPALHYLAATGDAGVLDERVPFLEGAAIPEGAEDAYYAPAVSDERGQRLRALRARHRPQPARRRARPAADGHAATGTTA